MAPNIAGISTIIDRVKAMAKGIHTFADRELYEQLTKCEDSKKQLEKQVEELKNGNNELLEALRFKGELKRRDPNSTLLYVDDDQPTVLPRMLGIKESGQTSQYIVRRSHNSHELVLDSHQAADQSEVPRQGSQLRNLAPGILCLGVVFAQDETCPLYKMLYSAGLGMTRANPN